LDIYRAAKDDVSYFIFGLAIVSSPTEDWTSEYLMQNSPAYTGL